MRIGSLFSGSGQLDEGVRTVFGGDVAWHAEMDPAASKVLAYRYPGVPNLGDITAVDWSAVEPVDVITGGSPCQDVSHAGKRAGMSEGTRSNLWVAMRDVVAALRPRLVVWENVRGAYSACADSEMGRCPRCVDPDSSAGHAPYLRALGRVVGDFSGLGYDVQWHGLRASDIGTPHERFRVFVTARDVQHPDRRVGGSPWTHQDQAPSAVLPFRRGHSTAPNATNIRHERSREARAGRDGPTHGDIDWGVYTAAIRRWERLTRPAPYPVTIGAKGGPQLAGAFTEWAMGWPGGWATAVPGISNNDALRLCGNGVVPQQAAAALRAMTAARAAA